MRDAHDSKVNGSIRALRTTRNVLGGLSSVAALIALPLLGGCAGHIVSLERDPSQAPVCETGVGTAAICGVSDIALSSFKVKGQGTCDAIGVNWGDGDRQTMPGNFDRLPDGVLFLSHKYREQYYPYGLLAWPGPKTVHVYSVNNCAGEAKLRINVLTERTDLSGNAIFSPTFNFGLGQPTSTACTAIANTRPLRAGATVHISEASGTRINFGCAGNACTYNMNGGTDPTPSHFPFPEMRKHSLVLRIVSADGQEQRAQGGTQASFVVDKGGALEVCVNDTILSDNSGAWGIKILVDETTVP